MVRSRRRPTCACEIRAGILRSPNEFLRGTAIPLLVMIVVVVVRPNDAVVDAVIPRAATFRLGLALVLVLSAVA